MANCDVKHECPKKRKNFSNQNITRLAHARTTKPIKKNHMHFTFASILSLFFLFVFNFFSFIRGFFWVVNMVDMTQLHSNVYVTSCVISNA